MRLKSIALSISLLLITPGVSSRRPVRARSSFLETPINHLLPRKMKHAKIEKDMAKKVNHEREAQLRRDTDNLLKLATELKQYVDKSNENTLSLDVIKKGRRDRKAGPQRERKDESELSRACGADTPVRRL